MSFPDITYYHPQTVLEALERLQELPGETRVLAGGTDIIPGFQQNSRRFNSIENLVDISDISDLKEIYRRDSQIHIGAGSSFSGIMRHELTRTHLPLLVQAASKIGSTQIRNRATLGGNFINNAPCADSVPPLLVYDARLLVRSIGGEREMSLAEFLLQPYKTQLQPGELVTQVIVPVPDTQLRGQFYKLGRRQAVAISRLSLAVLLKTADGKFSDFRLASGAVTPIGTRMTKIEQMAAGMEISQSNLRKLAVKIGEEVLAITGLRWSSAYKVPVLQQTAYQLLCQLTETTRDGTP